MVQTLSRKWACGILSHILCTCFNLNKNTFFLQSKYKNVFFLKVRNSHYWQHYGSPCQDTLIYQTSKHFHKGLCTYMAIYSPMLFGLKPKNFYTMQAIFPSRSIFSKVVKTSDCQHANAQQEIESFKNIIGCHRKKITVEL